MIIWTALYDLLSDLLYSYLVVSFRMTDPIIRAKKPIIAAPTMTPTISKELLLQKFVRLPLLHKHGTYLPVHHPFSADIKRICCVSRCLLAVQNHDFFNGAPLFHGYLFLEVTLGGAAHSTHGRAAGQRHSNN